MKTLILDEHGTKAEILDETDKFLLTAPACGGSLTFPQLYGYCVWGRENTSEKLIADFQDNKTYAELFFEILK